MNEDLKRQIEEILLEPLLGDGMKGFKSKTDKLCSLVETAISKAKEEERERIKKQCLLDTLMGGFNYHWHLKRDWIDREQLVQFLTQKK